MAIELVTGYQGKDHVTADQWADFNRGIFGKDTILPVGNRMETAIQTANQITVKDGVAVIDGRQVYIGYGESENIVIQSGTQGMLRRDIVVLEYNRDESGIESVAFKVITGEPKASDAVDPSVENTDIRTGVSSSQKPFCRVRLDGTAIEGVDALIPVREFQPHAFEDTVKDFTTTETGHVPDATLTKKLKDEVTKLNGNTTGLLQRELFIPGDTTNAPPNNKFLNISLKERFNAINRCHYFRQPNGTEFEGCPSVLKGKEFIGYRDIYWYSPINVMVQLKEFYPTPGRVWVNFYNSGTWTGWKSITPV